MEVKKTMSQTLRDLKEGKKELFPIERKLSVICTIQRLKDRGYRFTSFTDRTNNLFHVIKKRNPKEQPLKEK